MVIRLGDPFTGAFVFHCDAYLYISRHNIYYFRAIVPDGVKEELHKREYRRSMQTRSLQVARNMARVLRVCFEGHLEGIRSDMICWEELREILDKQLEQLISQEREKLRNAGPYPVTADDIWKFNTIPGYRQAIQDISLSRADSLSSGNIPKFARSLAEDILQSSNIELDRSSDLFARFCEATVRMYLEFTEQRVILNDEARSFQPVARSASVPPVSSDSFHHVDSQPLSKVVESYCEEMVAGHNWTAKTETEYRAAYKLLINIIHDRPVLLVDYPEARVFKETLMRLPSNMNKKPLYRDKSVQEVAAMHIPKNDLLSISKVNTYISRVSSLFFWAVKNGHALKNPFSGQKVKEKVADYEKRDPFENSDLIALFTSPEYQNGKHKHPYHYWLPLLGLFTGARIEELCQLYLDDIYQVEDLWVIDINSKDDKKLKTQSSARVLPIHSRLISFGLIEYVSKLRKKGEVRLLPELPKRRDGYSQDASKWFTRYRIRCGVTAARKTFHSFRHTVIDYLKQQGEVKEKIAAIAGHKDESMTMGWYGKPYEPATLISVIEKLDFPVAVPSFKV
jgi:integrase